ncbi:MAG: hypothetical protein R3D26_04740 [Cyanobacteriota/Melainabacteria group bacterium]
MIPEVSTVLQEEGQTQYLSIGQIISLGAALAGLIHVLCNQSAAERVEFIIPLLRFDSTSLFLISAIFFIGSVVTAYSQRYLIAWTKRVEFVEGVSTGFDIGSNGGIQQPAPLHGCLDRYIDLSLAPYQDEPGSF